MISARLTLLLVLAGIGGPAVLAAGQSSAPPVSSAPAKSNDRDSKGDAHAASGNSTSDRARPAAANSAADNDPVPVIKSEDDPSSAAAPAKAHAWTRKRRWRSSRGSRRPAPARAGSAVLPLPPGAATVGARVRVPAVAGSSAHADMPADSVRDGGYNATAVRPMGDRGRAAPAIRESVPAPGAVSVAGSLTAPGKNRQASARGKAVRKRSGGPGNLVLTQAKPDIAGATDAARDHTIESPMQAVGDGWKMVAYLLPTLAFVLVCLNLLRRYQQKNGKLPPMLPASRGANSKAGPSMVATFAGLFTANAGGQRDRGASANLRVLESITVGASTLHLVEVRGRTLLLAGGGAAGVTLLTEISEQAAGESNDFRQILQAAAADMDGLDLPNSDMPVSAVVGSLEDAMRETGDSIERRLRRLRAAQDGESNGV